MRLIFNAVSLFSKWTRPKPKPNKLKENKRSRTMSDQKAAKLSKSQQQLENKQRAVEAQKIDQETERKLKIYRKQDASLQQYISPRDLDLVLKHQRLYLKANTGALLDTSKNMKQLQLLNPAQSFQYLPNGRDPNNQEQVRFPLKNPPYGNYVPAVNKKYEGQIKPIAQAEIHDKMRRVGALGTKMGMTTLWDQWGHVVPATIILLDRVQVVQIKDSNHPDYSQVQVGMGDVNLKRITKPMLGHFMKAKVPPKKQLAEFRVSKSCVLPVGYMMSVRHYTPGMLVDVIGKTVGHGTSGTIKKFGFRRQPETHGNSLTTRVLGSTGGRQDPGRVFKNKKMYGKMGNKISIQKCLRVFKIDVDRNILYIRGSIPGKAGTVVKIRDTEVPKKSLQNVNLVSYPTFIEQAGKKYAKQMSMYCGERDPGEIEIHDNAFIIDDGEDDSATTTTATKDIPDD